MMIENPLQTILIALFLVCAIAFYVLNLRRKKILHSKMAFVVYNELKNILLDIECQKRVLADLSCHSKEASLSENESFSYFNTLSQTILFDYSWSKYKLNLLNVLDRTDFELIDGFFYKLNNLNSLKTEVSEDGDTAFLNPQVQYKLTYFLDSLYSIRTTTAFSRLHSIAAKHNGFY